MPTDAPHTTAEFIFRRPWTHAGIGYRPGDKAVLTPEEIRWLKDRGADKQLPTAE